MHTRLLEIAPNSPKSILLLGPRGVGKTSWAKNAFPNALYLDLLDADVYTPLQANPKRLEHLIPSDFSDWVVLDEVQKLPELLNEVHRLIESRRQRFILTGSSARSLKRKGVNLLAGRALHYFMHPLTAVELGEVFDLKQALLFGQLPSIASEPNPEHYLKTYVKSYLREEVLQEGLTRNLGTFTRFLEVASFSQGSLLNMSAIAREVGVNQKLAASYFEILEDLMLAYRLPVFTKRAKRRMVMHPKFYFFDVGVYRALRPTGPLDSPAEIGGIAAESLFLQNLKAINDYLQLGYEFYFWRTSYGTEVDFIAYGPRGMLAFEIKASSHIDKHDLKGLHALQADFPIVKPFLIYGGERREYYGDIQVIPMTQALRELPTLLSGEKIT